MQVALPMKVTCALLDLRVLGLLMYRFVSENVRTLPEESLTCRTPELGSQEDKTASPPTLVTSGAEVMESCGTPLLSSSEGAKHNKLCTQP